MSTGSVSEGVTLGLKLAKAVLGHRQQKEMRETRREHLRELDESLRSPPPVHGSAHWASQDELRAANILRSAAAFHEPTSILLGAHMEDGAQAPDGWLHWDGEGHLITVAPTRSGKSTMQIVPNLLRYAGSAVVLDPKGELYDTTSAWRRKIGPVYRIAPFEVDTHAFNPLDLVQSAADARALADIMIPEDPRAQDYFRKDAIAFLAGALEFVKHHSPKGRSTLAELRELTALPTDEFLERARWMSESPYPAVRNSGNIVLGKSKDRGVPNLRDTLNTELQIWDDPGVQRSTSRSDFTFHSLKDAPATVYITVPFGKMSAYGGYLRVVLASALEAMAQNARQPEKRVLFVLDEFLSLGTFAPFRDAIRTHAGYGVRLWFFLQNVSMLEELYPTSWRAFFDAAVQMFFGTTDVTTASMLSDTLSTTTVSHRSTTYSLGTSLSKNDFFDASKTDSLNVSHHVSLNSRPLMTSGEVLERLGVVQPDGTRHAIIKVAGAPPLKSRLVPYFAGQELPRRAGRLVE